MTTILGLTGGIASGKSTVTQMFLERQIPVIDTDAIAHNLLEKGTPVFQQIVEHFTADILLTDQTINRKKLAKIVFANKGKRELLNDLVHPEVYRIVDAEIAYFEQQHQPLVVVDVPLLFETGFQQRCDKTVVVYTTEEKQLERLMDRDQIDEEYAMMKITAQMPLEKKCEQADFVIDNSQSILDTKRDFITMLEQLEVT